MPPPQERHALVDLIDVLWPAQRKGGGAAGVRRITRKNYGAGRQRIEELILQARRGRRRGAERLQIEKSIIGDARFAEESRRERVRERQIDALVSAVHPRVEALIGA